MTESDTTIPPSPDPPPAPGALRFGQILHGLFLQPAILLILQEDRWTRALRFMMIVSFFSGAAAGVARLPSMWQSALLWAQWFRNETEVAWLKDDQLGWQRPMELPYTTRRRGWRIDFVAADAPFPPVHEPLGPERKGVWIAPDLVAQWWYGSGDKLHKRDLFVNGRIGDLVPVRILWPDGFRLEGEDFETETYEQLVHSAVIGVFLAGLGAFLHILIYTLVFAVIPFVFRSPIARRGFKRLFTFYLYASIPPTLVAATYAGLDLPYLDMPLAFVFGLLIYLVAVVGTAGVTVGAAGQSDDTPGPGKGRQSS